MTNIRERIDPDGTLPDVRLEPYSVQEWDGEIRERMDIIYDGEAIGGYVGECTVYTQNNPYKRKVHFDGIEIDEDLHGRGIGMAAYVAAIGIAHERGLPFETQDHSQTGQAKKIWETLVAKGVAEVVEPFRPSAQYPGRYEGAYRVPVPDLPGE